MKKIKLCLVFLLYIIHNRKVLNNYTIGKSIRKESTKKNTKKILAKLQKVV